MSPGSVLVRDRVPRARMEFVGVTFFFLLWTIRNGDRKSRLLRSHAREFETGSSVGGQRMPGLPVPEPTVKAFCITRVEPVARAGRNCI